MKHKESTGIHQTGKAGTSRRRHLSRLSALSGLAFLLSAGISEQARAQQFTFDYTYTITANTCSITILNNGVTATNGDVGVLSGPLKRDVPVEWGNVTQEQLTDPNKAVIKTFGLEMDCKGDIWKPTLKVTDKNGGSGSDLSQRFYVSDTPATGAGFAVELTENGGITQSSGTTTGSPTALSESASGNKRKIALKAWPTKLADPLKLNPGDDITGSVVIKVSYN